MLKPMPFQLIKIFKPRLNWYLDKDFFGFIEAEITISDKCKKILLVHRFNGEILHSSGTFQGIYFSEELRLYTKNPNYQIKYLNCYEFSKFFPFKEYVNTFYKIKSLSVGIERNISKLLLNNLYGFFGRKYRLITTLRINNNEINFLI